MSTKSDEGTAVMQSQIFGDVSAGAGANHHASGSSSSVVAKITPQRSNTLVTPVHHGRTSGAPSRRASFTTGVPSWEMRTPLSRPSSAPHPSSAPGCFTASAPGVWCDESNSPCSPESVASEPPSTKIRPRLGIVSRLPLVTRSASAKCKGSPGSPPRNLSNPGVRSLDLAQCGDEIEPDGKNLTDESANLSQRSIEEEDEDWETGTPQETTPNAMTNVAQGSELVASSSLITCGHRLASFKSDAPRDDKIQRGGEVISLASAKLLPPEPQSIATSPLAAEPNTHAPTPKEHLATLAEDSSSTSCKPCAMSALCQIPGSDALMSQEMTKGAGDYQAAKVTTPSPVDSWQELGMSERCRVSPCEQLGDCSRVSIMKTCLGDAPDIVDSRKLSDILLSPTCVCGPSNVGEALRLSSVGQAEARIGEDGVVRYHLTLRRHHTELRVLMRYREWRALRERLERAMPAVCDLSHQFPPRRVHLFALCASAPGGKHDPLLLNERTKSLSLWLDGVVRLLPHSSDCILADIPASKTSL